MAVGRELSINHEAQVYTRGDLFGFIMFPDWSAPRTLIRIQCIHLTFRIENRWKYNQTGARFSKVPVTLRARNQIFKSKYKG